MQEYSALAGVGKHREAFQYITGVSYVAIDEAFKKDLVVCVMSDDPNNLGAAIVSHFIL